MLGKSNKIIQYEEILEVFERDDRNSRRTP